MYKINNLFFGWDYVYWDTGMRFGISRVFRLPDGSPAYWRKKATLQLVIIREAREVIWLTCSPEKYGLK